MKKTFAVSIAIMIYCISGLVSADFVDESTSLAQTIDVTEKNIVFELQLAPHEKKKKKSRAFRGLQKDSFNDRTLFTAVVENRGNTPLRVSVRYIDTIWTGVAWRRVHSFNKTSFLSPGSKHVFENLTVMHPHSKHNAVPSLQFCLSSDVEYRCCGLRKKYLKGAEGYVRLYKRGA